MISGKWSLRQQHDDTWEVVGVGQAHAHEHAGVVLDGTTPAIILKRPGHNAYVGGGRSEYQPAEFEVWRILSDHGRLLTAELVCSFPASKPKE